MAARGTKYTPDRIERILTALRAGNTRKVACSYASIDQDTLTNWMHRYSDFSERVKKAEDEAEMTSVTIIRQAARENWTAAAWWLERRKSQDWGKVVRVDIEARIRIMAERAGLDPDDAVREAEHLLRELRGATAR